jgi:hypothetical protein
MLRSECRDGILENAVRAIGHKEGELAKARDVDSKISLTIGELRGQRLEQAYGLA